MQYNSGMAGTHRTRKRMAIKNTERVTIQIPAALKDDLSDAATLAGKSLAQYLLGVIYLGRATSQQRHHRFLSRDTYNALVALEPAPGDPRTDLEIAQQMDDINPYRGPDRPDGDVPIDLDAIDIDDEIEALHPSATWAT
jgi:uncharacterized protein (DUF1778 family)